MILDALEHARIEAWRHVQGSLFAGVEHNLKREILRAVTCVTAGYIPKNSLLNQLECERGLLACSAVADVPWLGWKLSGGLVGGSL